MSRRSGLCKLTLREGTFVDSHILPKALTKPEETGRPFAEGTKGKGYKKRFSSWYDRSLVIREGEDILARIDDAAIKELRKNMLIWDSWIVYKPYFMPLSPTLKDHSLRLLKPERHDAIHRFFISIAWRACASSLPEMSEAWVEAETLEEMRKATLNELPLSADIFPTTLTQLTTVGPRHNHTPFRDRVINPFSKNGDESWEVIRIYANGLIAHVHLNAAGKYALSNKSFLSGMDDLAVPGIRYEASFQHENLLVNAWEAHAPFGSFER